MIGRTVLQCTHQRVNPFRPRLCPTTPRLLFVRAASVVMHHPLLFRLFNLKTGRFDRKINLTGKRSRCRKTNIRRRGVSCCSEASWCWMINASFPVHRVSAASFFSQTKNLYYRNKKESPLSLPATVHFIFSDGTLPPPWGLSASACTRVLSNEFITIFYQLLFCSLQNNEPQNNSIPDT